MKSIHVNGNRFRIGNGTRTILTRTSFCLLGHYQRRERDKAKRWLDRIQTLGFDGPRLFGENQDWFPGDTFFGTRFTPRIDAFGEHSGPFSQLRLVDGYEGLVTQLAMDLAERDMIAEFCCIATVKGRTPEWTSHGLNKFAQLFRSLFPYPQETPFLHEAINEWDAHSSLANDPEEVERIGTRWRRTNDADPTHHNYPGSTIGVSAGGQWKPGMDDRNYTHRNIHPERGATWWMGEKGEALDVTIGRLLEQGGGRPVYLNETVHTMTQEQWDEWIPRVPKWAGLSTTNYSAVAVYLKKVRDLGASVCFHDLIGMSTDPDAPISVAERAVAEQFGGGDPPDPPLPKEPAMRQVVVHRNGKTTAYKYEREPSIVKGGDESLVLREKTHFQFQAPGTIRSVAVFHGTDGGDIVEQDTEIYADGGIPVYLRSDHKEIPVSYDAWKSYDTLIRTSGIDIAVVCRTNGKSQRGTWESRPHWGIWVTVVED